MNTLIIHDAPLIISVITYDLILVYGIALLCKPALQRSNIDIPIPQFKVSSDQMQCKCRSYYDFNTMMHELTNRHLNFKCDCEIVFTIKQAHAHLVKLQDVYESVSTCIMCECLFLLMHTGRHHCDLTAVRFFT